MSGSVHIVAVMPAPQGGIITCNRLGILICAAMFAERTVTATRTAPVGFVHATWALGGGSSHRKSGRGVAVAK